MQGPKYRDPSYICGIWQAGVASKSVKLQKSARATACSHSVRDVTASVRPILSGPSFFLLTEAPRAPAWHFDKTTGSGASVNIGCEGRGLATRRNRLFSCRDVRQDTDL